MKILKWFLVCVAGVIVLVAGAMYVLLTSYKKELQEELIAQLKSRYGIELQTSRVTVSLLTNWPRASLKLNDVTLSSDRFPDSRIEAGALSVSFNVERLLNREFRINQLSIADGYIIFVKPPEEKQKPESLIRDTTADEPIDFDIEKIVIKSCRLRAQNPANGQDFLMDLIDNVIRIRTFSDGLYARLKGPINVLGIQFRANRGHFFTKSHADFDLDLSYLNDFKTLCVRPGSKINVDDQEFSVTAVAWLGDEKRLGMMVAGEKIDYKKVTRLMNHRIRRSMVNFDVKKPVDATITLVASIGKREEPAFVVHMSGENNDLLIGSSKIPYSNLEFKGKLVCVDSSGVRGDIAHAFVSFQQVKGLVYDFPFKGSVRADNLLNPYISIKGEIQVDPSKLKIPRRSFDLGGHAVANVSYSGPADKLNSREFLDPPMRMSASVQMTNVSYRERGSAWRHVASGTARLSNRDMEIEDVNLVTGIGTARIKGTARDFVSYVLGFSKAFTADITVKTDEIDLNPLFENAGADPADPDEPAVTEVGLKENDGALAEAACTFDKACSNFSFTVRVHAKKIGLRKLTAEHARMQLKYRRGVLEFPFVEMKTCDGNFRASGEITGLKKLRAEVVVSDADVYRLFEEFENFGQAAITSSNLRGRIYIEASFNTHLNNRLEIAPETMFADVRLSIKDGQLIDFDPVKKLSNFVFRNRDFSNVKFSELSESFTLRGPLIEISELEVASSLLNFYVVNGIYNFRGHSNINILLPWNNLKKRGSDYVPHLSGRSASDTKGVRLNFAGPPHQLRISIGHKEAVPLRSSI
jgi:hypothetical protein